MAGAEAGVWLGLGLVGAGTGAGSIGAGSIGWGCAVRYDDDGAPLKPSKTYPLSNFGRKPQ